MLSQIHDPTLLRFASILVASLLSAPGGVAADTPVPASGKAGMESGTDGNGVTAPKEACDLLMIGDSLIDTLHEFGGKYAPLEAVWNRHYAPRHAIDLGHSGIRTEGTLANLEGGEMGGRTPKVAVLLIGTNNTDERGYPPAHTPEQICATTKAIVTSILRQSPATKVLILRIFPKGGDDEPGVGEGIFHSSVEAIEIARRAGELTAELADGKQVFWLDINLGFGADRIPQVLWRLDHGALDGMAPKRVVLMIGANHVLGDEEPPDAVVDGIRACLQRIRAKTPEAKITLMAVLPCRNPASHPERLKVLRINDGLAALAKEAKVDFLDLGAKFLDAEGNIPVALMSDAVHPTLAGYQIWGDTLAPSLP